MCLYLDKCILKSVLNAQSLKQQTYPVTKIHKYATNWQCQRNKQCKLVAKNVSEQYY